MPDSRPPVDRPAPWIIGHRGVAAEETENTLASLLLAVRQRADMIELDVQMAGDGDLVVFHDWDLERLAGRPEVVEESPADLLRGFMPVMPTLRQVLDELPETMPLNVEIKRKSADPSELARRLGATLGARPRILVSSFDWEVLAAVRSELPSLAIGPLAHDSTDGLLDVASDLDSWSVHCHHEIADDELLDEARRAERPVLVYTVNEDESVRELFRRGVSGVFTDTPGRLRARLGL